MLTDTDIERLVEPEETWRDRDSTLQISPFAASSMTPVGYDLRVGSRYSSSIHPGPGRLEPGRSISVAPGETVLITTLETVGMPKNRGLSGIILSKVSLVSKGLSHISTTIDPDWEGPLLIALNNLGRAPVELGYGDTFATAIFFRNDSPATRSVNRPPGRTDILLAEWARQMRRVARRDRALFFAQPGVVLLAMALGFVVFGNGPGTVASVAVGVAISQFIARIGSRGI